jgi:hypothetical protein
LYDSSRFPWVFFISARERTAGIEEKEEGGRRE